MTAQPLTEAEFRRALDRISDYGQLSHHFIARVLAWGKHEPVIAGRIREICAEEGIPLDAREEEGR